MHGDLLGDPGLLPRPPKGGPQGALAGGSGLRGRLLQDRSLRGAWPVVMPAKTAATERPDPWPPARRGKDCAGHPRWQWGDVLDPGSGAADLRAPTAPPTPGRPGHGTGHHGKGGLYLAVSIAPGPGVQGRGLCTQDSPARVSHTALISAPQGAHPAVSLVQALGDIWPAALPGPSGAHSARAHGTLASLRTRPTPLP